MPLMTWFYLGEDRIPPSIEEGLLLQKGLMLKIS